VIKVLILGKFMG